MRNIKTYSRYFSFILYEEDKEQMKGYEYIKEHFDYASILHDRDKLEDGEIKKSHYHIIIRIGKNPRNRKAISKETGIQENYIEGCNKEKMLLYLIHYNNPEKTQYSIEEVKGALKEDLEMLIKQKTNTNEEILDEIIRYIYNNKVNMFELTNYCIKRNYYKQLKENQYLLSRLVVEQTKLIEERNNKYNEHKRYR